MLRFRGDSFLGMRRYMLEGGGGAECVLGHSHEQCRCCITALLDSTIASDTAAFAARVRYGKAAAIPQLPKLVLSHFVKCVMAVPAQVVKQAAHQPRYLLVPCHVARHPTLLCWQKKTRADFALDFALGRRPVHAMGPFLSLGVQTKGAMHTTNTQFNVEFPFARTAWRIAIQSLSALRLEGHHQLSCVHWVHENRPAFKFGMEECKR